MKTKVMTSLFGSGLLSIFLISTASAQVQRTFVSGLGSDGNPCSRTAPCRTFGQAISQTNASGEVYVLDSAGYGAFSINKSISIVAPAGVTAGISVFSGTGITINTNTLDTVTLRGLTINNQGSSGDGISFANLGVLRVENCIVNGFSNSGGLGGDGLAFAPADVFQALLVVKDSIFRDNFNGINVLGGQAVIEQVMLEGGINLGDAGLKVNGLAGCTVRNSVATGYFYGFQAISTTSRNADLWIENCSAFQNQNGVSSKATSTGTATVRVSNSTMTNNNWGLANLGPNSSFILSRGNNTVDGNVVADTFGTIGSYSPK